LSLYERKGRPVLEAKALTRNRLKKKILLVDNHPVMLQLMKKLIEREGHQVMTAEDGLSALDILKGYIPDVMFIDLIMPNIGGKKLCQIIRKTPALEGITLVILSATAAEEQSKFSDYGADACIAKAAFDDMSRNVLDVLNQPDRTSFSNLQGKVLGLENIHARGITRELLSVKRHFEVILESMSEGILEITPEARITYANAAALSVTGKAEETLLASDFIELFCERDRAMIKDNLRKALHPPQPIFGDSTLKLDEKEVSINLIPIREEGDWIIVILQDLTERKRIEAQLQQAQKMEAIGTLAGGIAHDFNNLLMAIQGNASLMLLDIDPENPHFERLMSIEKQVQSATRLTSQLLGYARKGSYEVKPLDLNLQVEETSSTFWRTRKEITIHKDLAQDLFSVEADEGQIEQVLLNMYVNAADAMPGGGELFLKTRNVEHTDMRGGLYEPRPGHYVLLTIEDRGIGMDRNTMERIFDPFFTTKEMGRGTGLGLASVYGIIKGHGGYIDVDSKKGFGTTFMIYLPASGKRVRKERRSEARIYRGSETVLLVDDEAIVLQVGREMLEVLGYRVITARSGTEAIKILRKDGQTPYPDLVILDLVMPKMGGGEVFDRIREIDPCIKILLSSGYSVNGEAAEILERGCDGFIQKPFKLKDLSGSIRKLLEVP